MIGKIKDETGDAIIEEFVGLKPKMYSIFVDDNNNHKKVKNLAEILLPQKNHTECKDILLNKNI